MLRSFIVALKVAIHEHGLLQTQCIANWDHQLLETFTERVGKSAYHLSQQPLPRTMAAWLPRQLPSHPAQIAVLSGIAVAGAIFGIQAIQRQLTVDDLRVSKLSSNGNHGSKKVLYFSLSIGGFTSEY